MSSSTSSWCGQLAFEKELKGVRTRPSSSRMRTIAKHATDDFNQYKLVVKIVEHQLTKSTSNTRYAFACVIDAILSKSVEKLDSKVWLKDPFPMRFAKNMGSTLRTLADCEPDMQKKLARIVKLWLQYRKFPKESRGILQEFVRRCSTSSNEGNNEKQQRSHHHQDATLSPPVNERHNNHESHSDTRITRVEARQDPRHLAHNDERDGHAPLQSNTNQLLSSLNNLSAVTPATHQQHHQDGSVYNTHHNVASHHFHQQQQQQQQTTSVQSAAAPIESYDDVIDDFDYGDDEDDDERIAEQRRRLEDDKRRIDEDQKRSEEDRQLQDKRLSQQQSRSHHDQIPSRHNAVVSSQNPAASQHSGQSQLSVPPHSMGVAPHFAHHHHQQQLLHQQSPQQKLQHLSRFDSSSATTASSSSAVSTEVNENKTVHRGWVTANEQDNVPPGMLKVMSTVVFVGGIPDGSTTDSLRIRWKSFGVKIGDIRIVKRNAFIKYNDREAAETAQDLIRSYDIKLKTGWGKGDGMDSANFDQLKGIGLISERMAPSLPPVPPLIPLGYTPPNAPNTAAAATTTNPHVASMFAPTMSHGSYTIPHTMPSGAPIPTTAMPSFGASTTTPPPSSCMLPVLPPPPAGFNPHHFVAPLSMNTIPLTSGPGQRPPHNTSTAPPRVSLANAPPATSPDMSIPSINGKLHTLSSNMMMSTNQTRPVGCPPNMHPDRWLQKTCGETPPAAKRSRWDISG